MPAPLTMKITNVTQELVTSIRSLSVPVARAATAAITDASGQLKSGARGAIASAGFSRRFQNAYRVDVFPRKGKVSIDAAAFGRFRSIGYSDIFQTGGTISGKPMLWLPLKSTPKIDRRKAAADIRDYRAKGVKLVTLPKSGHPLLGVEVQMSKTAAKQKRVKLSLSEIMAGQKGRTKPKKGFVKRTVPLFFGLPSVTIRKRFDITAIARQIAQSLPKLYERYINKMAAQ